jgi:hypothetical protein
MSHHLTPDELVTEVDQVWASDRRAHLDGCEICQRQVDDLRRVLRDVRSAGVPEPSPLFWAHLAARVRMAVAEEEQPRATWLPAWVGWRVAVPIAAMAVLIAVLVNAVPREAHVRALVPIAAVETDSASPESGDLLQDDASWQLVSDLTQDMNLDEGSDVGLVMPGAVERATSDLEPAERAELLRLLRAELGRPES